jgi:colicin import membrane protein
MVDVVTNDKAAADARAKAAADAQKAQTAADEKAKADADAKYAKDYPERAKAKKEYEAAQVEARKLQQEAIEAHAKAEQKAKTPEQVAAEDADKKAGDALAKAAALHPDANPPADAPAGHRSPGGIKLNIPASPAYAPGIPTNDEAQTVNLYHMTEDGTERAHTRVHPDMVGDFMRAGWRRA